MAFDFNSIPALPSIALRRHVAMSVLGSINYQLASTAHAVASALETKGYDLRDLEVRDIKALLGGPDSAPNAGSIIPQMKALYRAQRHMLGMMEQSSFASRSTVLAVSDTDEFGTIRGTIANMCKPMPAKAPAREGMDALKALGIEVTEAHLQAAAREQRETAARRAERFAALAGTTEWIVDNVFACVDDDEDPSDPMLGIDKERYSYLAEKAINALTTAINKATTNALTGRSGDGVLGVGDILLAREMIPVWQAQLVTKAVKPRVAKAKVPGAKKARAKARRVVKGSADDKKPTTANTPVTLDEDLALMGDPDEHDGR